MRRAVLFGGIAVGGLLLLGAALFVGILLGERGDTGNGGKVPGIAADKKAGVGDTQNVGELRVTLVEAFRTDGGKNDDDSRDKLPPNGTFVVARVRVENGTPETLKWGERYVVVGFSTDGRLLQDVVLSRQIDPTVPREDQVLYNTQVRPGGDVTGTLVFIAERDEEVSL
jgi:hypothetical protein